MATVDGDDIWERDVRGRRHTWKRISTDCRMNTEIKSRRNVKENLAFYYNVRLRANLRHNNNAQ